MHYFDDVQTAERLPMGPLLAALETMFRQDCEVPLRHNHLLGNSAQGATDSLLIMPAWQAGGYLGVKLVTIFPGNSTAGIPGLHSTYTLFDARNGVPLAIIAGDPITARRTAAASALAARFLARPDASRLLVLGAGRVASVLPEAYAQVRTLSEVAIWDIDPARAAALAEKLAEAGMNARPAQDLEGEVGRADMVSCATLSEAPLVRRAWVRPGTHVDLIGSFQPFMRESDDALFADTSVFVDTGEALLKSGDLLSPMKSGVFAKERVLATLEDLCRGVHPGRKDAGEITVYKAVGAASEDLAAAMLVYEGAGRAG